jgi:hypothetical protein
MRLPAVSRDEGRNVSRGLVRAFLEAKARTLASRATRLTALTPAMFRYDARHRHLAPSAAHFAAANRRLQSIRKSVTRRLEYLQRRMPTAPARETLVNMAMVEKEIDRARRTFGMFFEIFGQRGSAFAPALAAHDAIAADCYAAIRSNAPKAFDGPLLEPLTYMEHGYSPATMRRGVTLSRLLGERNPFPLIRIPWDRDNPWQAVFLHEVSHNLQADLNVWQENKNALMKRLIRSVGDPFLIATYTRWHKEIFADLAAILLGGSASAWGMMDFLAHPPPRTFAFRAASVHPTGYLRVLVLAEMLRRMRLAHEGARLETTWRSLYHPPRTRRMPRRLLSGARRVITEVVDEIAFQPRRNLGQRALADVIVFRPDDEQRIRGGARVLARGRVPSQLPPRFLVSASRHAVTAGASPRRVSDLVIRHLAAASLRDVPRATAAALAAA